MKKKYQIQINIDPELSELLSQVYDELNSLSPWEIAHIKLAVSSEPFVPTNQPLKKKSITRELRTAVARR